MADLLLLSTPLAGDRLPGGVCPSLSNVTLASHGRRAGCDVAVLDPSVDLGPVGDDAEGLLDRVVEGALARRPRVVGLSALSPVEGRFAAAFAQRLRARAPATPVVVGGIWASACADELLDRCPAIDGVVVGPGEDAVVALARRGLDAPDDVPGLVWRRGAARVASSPGRLPPAKPLDSSVLAHPEHYDIFCWQTSRGCPFTCSFCTEHLTSPHFATAPGDTVAADVAAFAAAPKPWYLWICDPLFGARRDHLALVCSHLAATGLPFLVESRVDVLHPDDVPALAAAGCNLIYFGLEAVSRRSLAALGKVTDRPHRHRRYLDGARALVEACVRHDVLPVMGVLNPVPGDTADDLDETLAFVTELAALGRRLGGDLAPCFHAFPLRIDRGADYARRLDALRAQGATFTEPADPLFGDRYLAGASPSVDAGKAEAFRAAVRALNPASETTRRRLWRSFPRPYVEVPA